MSALPDCRNEWCAFPASHTAILTAPTISFQICMGHADSMAAEADALLVQAVFLETSEQDP